MEHPAWPALPLDEWEPTYLTLHRWTQVVGKVRLALAPPLNHWWHATLYVSSFGLTTSSMPAGDRHLTITFDFCRHRLVAHTSDHRTEEMALEPMTVADFYQRTLALLARLGVQAHVSPVPQEMADTTRFTEDTRHASYDRDQVERLHRLLVSCDRVFSTYRGRFLGKSSPVHFFWGGFDLAVTRFSGKRNPAPPPDRVMGPAYSHEVISHGFWPGGDWPGAGRVAEPLFYAYAVPPPDGLRTATVRPAAARWDDKLGEFVLPYDRLRTADDPDATLLDFMESTYLAAAERAGWDIDGLRRA